MVANQGEPSQEVWQTKNMALRIGAAQNVECKVVSIEQRDGTRLLVCQGAVK